MTEFSVIIAAHDRPQPLRELLACLRQQTFADFEIIVVDDGSMPPLATDPPVRLIRTEGVERSNARNIGAQNATGRKLLFLDDDLTVAPDFLDLHAKAHSRWPEALVVGRVALADRIVGTPFGRFRQRLENSGIPQKSGLVMQRNFCAAGNMSIAADHFRHRGGFDPQIVSGEDQDFALRHTAAGLPIAYIPEAVVVHHDTATDIESYCRRVEWANEKLLPFCRTHPSLPENVERERVNGPAPAHASKMAKDILATAPARSSLFALTSMVERIAPSSVVLDRLYRLLIGIHARRGFIRGWREHRKTDTVRLGEVHA